jgi:predicted nucleic-acid-binding protein
MNFLLMLIFFTFQSAVFCYAENSTLLIPKSSLLEANFASNTEDELQVIEQLIRATTQQLEAQKQIKELMLQFGRQKEDFIQGNQTKSHAGRMVRTARQINEMLAANHLEHLFAKDYLDELTFFSSIAGKTAVRRP